MYTANFTRLFNRFVGSALLTLVLAGFGARAAELRTSAIHLKYESKEYVLTFYEPFSSSPTQKHAGVLLIPEYWGKDGLETVQAQRLAEKGYVVLVMDLYGMGRHSLSAKTADEYQAEAEESGLTSLLGLVSKSLEMLKANPDVDSHRIAAVVRIA